MRVELSSFIEGDLEDIGDWIAQDNPRRAVTFIQELRKAFRKIGENPFHYQLRPDIGEEARLLVVGRYVILFRVDEEVVRIERILFGGRDLPPLSNKQLPLTPHPANTSSPSPHTTAPPVASAAQAHSTAPP